MEQPRCAVTWWDEASNETGYVVERCTGATCTNDAAIATVPAHATEYEDLNVRAKTAYRYRVKALNGVGASAYSNEAPVTTP